MVLFLGASVTLAGGCVTAPERGGESTQWRFLPIESVHDSTPPLEPPVVVRLIETRAASAIDRRDMAYSRDRQSIAYYRDNRWAASPAVMLDEVIDETLTAQPWVRGVIRGGGRVPADLGLHCEISRLEHQLGEPGGAVRLRAACSWYRIAARELVAATVFDQRQAVEHDDAAHFAAAAQSLVDRLLTALVADGRALAEAVSDPDD
jgi:cholesterol transport system auxiliary component